MGAYDAIQNIIDSYAPPQTPTHEESRETFKLLLDTEDNEQLIQEFLLNNIRLVASAVTKFIQRHQDATYLIDDMFSAGVCRVLKSTRSLVRRGKNNQEAFWKGLGRTDETGNFHLILYLYLSAYRRIQVTYERDSVNAISDRASYEFTPTGEDAPLRKVDIPDYFLDTEEADHLQAASTYLSIQEICKDDYEREIIKRRLSQSDIEIAEHFGCSKQHIWRRRMVIQARYELHQKENSDDQD